MFSKLICFCKESPNFAISIPTILCFIQFIYEALDIMDGQTFDGDRFGQLLSSANGFETVCLCLIMLVLKRKKK